MNYSASMDLNDFDYHLPNNQIAQFPLEKREASKFLIYNKGTIHHDVFARVNNYLPKHATLYLNNAKVVPARLFFRKTTGAIIEVVLLSPHNTPLEEALKAKEGITWKCIIGNARKWKMNTSLEMGFDDIKLKALRLSGDNVRFSWQPSVLSFLEIIEQSGKMPLPPYINREVIEEDKERYQTVYSKTPGAVAAPTAGLHFTKAIINQLGNAGHLIQELTLHVGAGTFKPIQSSDIKGHPMHNEEIIINKENIRSIIQGNKNIAVGTTAARTLESIYWIGVRIIENEDDAFFIPKLYPYQFKPEQLPGLRESLNAVEELMQAIKKEEIIGKTELFIFPGYRFKVIDGLFTNFHLPKSTLILLIAALIGKGWQKVYAEALQNAYRFLSYGDTSLLMP